MKLEINNIQEKVKALPGVNHVDENWGQLDYYSSHPPVKFPCVLIDVLNINYSNIGKDRSATPQNRQMGGFSLEIRVSDVKLTNSSGNAPTAQRDQARSIFDLIESIHEILQGYEPSARCGKLLRASTNKVMRDDGIREFAIIYSGDVQDV